MVQEFDDDISSDLKVYSLAFPPLTAEELASYSVERTNYTLAIIIASITLGAGIGYLLYRRSKARHSDDEDEIRRVGLPSDNKTEPAMRANSIYLFGEFTVRDRNNRNITYMFSAKLKQTFCLLLQYSTVDDGIASQHLSNILWPDKPADKVKNSRGVTINHLRKVLTELDGVELIYDKGYFKLILADELYCDYIRCLQIISDSKLDEHRDELVEILAGASSCNCRTTRCSTHSRKRWRKNWSPYCSWRWRRVLPQNFTRSPSLLPKR